LVNLSGWHSAKKGEVCKAVTAVTAIQVNIAKLGSGEFTQTQLAVGPCKREQGDKLSRKVGKHDQPRAHAQLWAVAAECWS